MAHIFLPKTNSRKKKNLYTFALLNEIKKESKNEPRKTTIKNLTVQDIDLPLMPSCPRVFGKCDCEPLQLGDSAIDGDCVAVSRDSLDVWG